MTRFGQARFRFMRISILSPRLPPATCGVGDHACRLAAAFINAGCEVGLIHFEARADLATNLAADLGAESTAVPAPLPGDAVHHWDGSSGSLHECVSAQGAQWLWVQLSAYGYSRFGAPIGLGRALARLRRRRPGLRIALYLHETHCQPHQLGFKGPVLHHVQKHAVGRIARMADLAFTSIARYAHQVMADYAVAADRVIRLPIGPNVPTVELDEAQRRCSRADLGWARGERIGVCFGLVSSQVRALTGARGCLEAGLGSGQLSRLVCVGGSEDEPIGELLRWREHFAGYGPADLLGPQPAPRVGELLACADVAVAAVGSDLLGKSGAFAAYASAGLAVIIPGLIDENDVPGHGLGLFPADSFTWTSQEMRAMESARDSMRQFARAHYDWSAIGRTALDALAAVDEVADGSVVA